MADCAGVAAANFSVYQQETSATYRNVYMVEFILTTIHSLLSGFLFWFYRKGRPRLESRLLSVAFACSFATIAIDCSAIHSFMLSPCWLEHLGNLFFLPVAGATIFARLNDFANKQMFGRLIAGVELDDLFRAEEDASSTAFVENNSKGFWGLVGDCCGLFGAPRGKKERTVRALKFLTSPHVLPVLYLFIALPYIIIFIIVLKSLDNCAECELSGLENTATLVAAILLIIIGSIGAFLIRNFKDHLGKKQEILLYMFGAYFTLIFFILSQIDGDSVFHDTFSFIWIMWIGFQIMQFVTVTLQVILALREGQTITHRAMKQRTRSLRNPTGETSIVVSKLDDTDMFKKLTATLKSPIEHQEFEEFLINEFAVENLRMYDECETWKMTFNEDSPKTRRVRAKRIYHLFIEPNSVFDSEFFYYLPPSHSLENKANYSQPPFEYRG